MKFYEESYEDMKIVFHKPPAAIVEMISMTPDAEKLVAYVNNVYKGNMHPVLEGTTLAAEVKDMQMTKLQTAFEMIHFLFRISMVTRAFTHQLVRYRIGTAFAQESMRFYGAKKEYNVLASGQAEESYPYTTAAMQSIVSYHKMVKDGVASEDARGILPTNIMTGLYFDCSLRTLQNIFTQRMCCQAQSSEWPHVLIKMRRLIAERSLLIAGTIKANVELGRPCGFNASFDRPCTWSNEIKLES